MKYKDILKEIDLIKTERSDFINKFHNDYEFVYDTLNNAMNNKAINSIRVHKYLTDNKILGKVKTAKYLETIGLNENTKISELNQNLIMKIANFSKHT